MMGESNGGRSNGAGPMGAGPMGAGPMGAGPMAWSHASLYSTLNSVGGGGFRGGRASRQ